jgi:hypothetical protein
MRTFFFVLAIAMVAIYNIAGLAGVCAWLTCMTAWCVGCLWGWVQTLANTSQANLDDDAGDACDNDDDNNGLTDEEEEDLGTDPTNADTDGDGDNA